MRNFGLRRTQLCPPRRRSTTLGLRLLLRCARVLVGRQEGTTPDFGGWFPAAPFATRLPGGTADQHVFGFSMAGFVSDHTRQLVLDVQSVPEPSLLVAAALAVLGLAWRERLWRRSDGV